MIRSALAAALLWSTGGIAANADTLSLGEYLSRLRQARSLVLIGNVGEARALLLRTTALRVADGTLEVRDAPLASQLASATNRGAALDAIESYIALVERESARAIDVAQADAALGEVIRQERTPRGSQSLTDAIVLAVQRFLSGLEGPRPNPIVVVQIAGGLGLALLLFVVGTLGRGLRERVRAEVILSDPLSPARLDPTRHLAAADRAIADGRARDAVHALYLYALHGLAAREAIRYDPALTDRELLTRAAGIPHADALRDLVALYERSWFGVREPDWQEAQRARTLATRVAG